MKDAGILVWIFPVDAIISYVNGNDPIWLEAYKNEIGNAPDITRFRDWGTLKYILRGIDKFMPFIDRVMLIVSSDSQVPGYINRDTVKIIKHEDFIPAKYLPTFNSNTIELFIPKIEGLSDKFLYYNDDFFVVMPCTEEDFFIDGVPKINMQKIPDVNPGFKKICENSYNLANLIVNGKKTSFKTPFVPQHTITPMIRSKCLEWLKNGYKTITETISRERKQFNVCQYLYTDALFINGCFVNEPISFEMLRYCVDEFDYILETIKHPRTKTICINEPQKQIDSDWDHDRLKITEAFEILLPNKSKHENNSI